MSTAGTGAAGQAPATPTLTPIAELRGITKTFGTLVANDHIDLDVRPGEVHALLGENGAGKSTLTRILYGLSQPDSGAILVDGKPVTMSSPAVALASGIGMVTQEFSLVGPMTVTENIMLPQTGLGVMRRAAAREAVEAASHRLGVTVDPDAIVENLSVGERQRVEILKVLVGNCRLLILDEPTAVLVPQDVDALFASIRRLTDQGMGVIFISHHLNEVTQIANRVSILKRGRIVSTQEATGLSPERIAALMVGGQEPGETTATEPAAPTRSRQSATPALVLDALTMGPAQKPRLDGVSLTVHGGEIVGIAGVSGNGQNELLDALCAMRQPLSGHILLGDLDITNLTIGQRIAAGFGRLSDDRRGSVIPDLSVEHNLVIEDLHAYRRGPFLDRAAVREHAEKLIADYDIKATPATPIRTLSGGNMQKVLLARALSRKPRALAISQPTRGLDVGACEYVYTQLRALRDAGAGVLLVSEDLDELLEVADRILVLFAGRIIGEMPRETATKEALGLLMTGQEAAS